MRIFIFGQRDFGAAAFDLSRRLGHDVVGVSSPPLNGAGDGPDRLRQRAAWHGVPWHHAGCAGADSMPPRLDLILAAHAHDFIGERTRRRSRLGALGYHPSLLPRHRGRDAVRWAIHMREPVTGGTAYWLDNSIDGGPIAAQDWCWVDARDSDAELWRRELMPIGLRLFEAVLLQLASGTVVRRPQDESLATFEPAFDPPRVFRPELPLLPAPPL